MLPLGAIDAMRRSLEENKKLRSKSKSYLNGDIKISNSDKKLEFIPKNPELLEEFNQKLEKELKRKKMLTYTITVIGFLLLLVAIIYLWKRL